MRVREGRGREEKRECVGVYVYLETGSCCIAQVGLELEIFLPQPPKFWD
jgi:hypothetical protein